MNQKVLYTPPALAFTLLQEGSGYQLVPTGPAPLSGNEVYGNQFIFATLTPTAAYCSFDPVNGTESGAGATVASEWDGFSVMGQANFFSLSARQIDSPTDDLLDNTIIMSVAGVEIGRINVDVDAQNSGELIFRGPGSAASRGDARFAMAGGGNAVNGGTVEADDDTYTKTSHGLYTGQKVKIKALTGGTGLVDETVYYFHKLTANTGKLCSTYANAIAGTAVAVTVDASNIDLEYYTSNIEFSLVTADPNLLIDLRIIGGDSTITT